MADMASAPQHDDIVNWEVLQAHGVPVPERILLYGPPGTGKTTLAQALADKCGLPLVAISFFECKGRFLGESSIKVKQVFERARAQRPCILFVDEFDVSEASQDASGAEMAMAFLTELDEMKDEMKSEGGFFFLAAAIHLTGINAALLSRFSERIQIPYPDEDQRRRILQNMIARVPTDFGNDFDIHFDTDFDIVQVCAELAAATGEVSGRDLHQLVARATRYSMKRALSTDTETGTAQDLVLKCEDLLRALKR
jgi:transitional endoplasmic reticulum ATPase